ncbi:MAG TPA: M13 family metallopeptidase [Crocinitomicaceae bacterium]|nr:M13 family metallopeptidase [Crocinitomicaceae bacterium]
MKKTFLTLTLAIPLGLVAQKKTFDVSYMDKSVSPKKDFYLYSNGNWVKNNPVPKTESRWGSFNELERDNYVKIEKIFSDLKNKVYKDYEVTDIAGINLSNYYQSFINENRKSADYAGLKTLRELAKGLNLGESTKSEAFAKSIAFMHKMGIDVFFSFGIEQDLKQNDLHVPYLSQTRLGLPNKDYYADKKFQQYDSAYRVFIGNLFIDMRPANANYDAKSMNETGKKMADKVIQIEKWLADGMFSPVEMRDIAKNYNPLDLSKLEQVVPNFNWNVYFKEMGIDMAKAKFIVVSQMPYFENLNKFFGTFRTADLQEYVQYVGLSSFAPYLNDRFEENHFNFYNRFLLGKQDRKPISHQAIDNITRMPLGDALGKYFVQYYYTAEASKKINTMVDDITIVMKERIEKLTWMSEDTKKQALVKLGTFTRKLGFPKKWKDFSSLKLTADNLTQNVIALRRYAVNENLSKLGKPIDKDEWGMPAHMVNAYYNPLQNEIAFPAGIMQAPFFDINFEDAVNYARIGMVIGHEITHGFDDQGAQFAADGSFSDWWNEDDKKKFTDLTTTYGETFSHFCPFTGECVNPNLTMGENIADLGGVTLAYYAYMRTNEFKKGEKINGYTPAQRFFISFAQIWKINYTDGELKSRLANDPHSPGMYRVNGPLMNCPEFFEAFDIKEGDAMRNPKGKMTVIW